MRHRNFESLGRSLASIRHVGKERTNPIVSEYEKSRHLPYSLLLLFRVPLVYEVARVEQRD
jgi:hypothetical protein